MIAQLRYSSRLYANQTRDRQTPAIVLVEESGTYHITIFAIREGMGILDTNVEYTGKVMVPVMDNSTITQGTTAQDTAIQDTTAQDNATQDDATQDTATQDTATQVTATQDTPSQATNIQDIFLAGEFSLTDKINNHLFEAVVQS